ncbi:M48 family metalloprotease [Roseivirga misakiensis]|uniref:Peptidase M48 n=1 Tax=Roseivirga misakiensis TaxID=1563681 RepID=A0A1E5SYM1_9BACT|nr:M48 family metalloprotease [Roseivirga misakiensis]OEK04220.1 peptidase M48 [Roseivirga misakiensis]
MSRKITPLILFAFVLLFSYSCATNPVTGKKEFMLLSEEKEIAMGKESDPGIVSFFGLYEDEKLQQFIEEKGKEMAAISHRPNLPYEFKIVDSPVLNAFAVPGGFVYFTRGIMAHFNNEAEFAGVLGHEIGHVTARHSAQQYSNQQLAGVGLMAGTLVSETFAQYASTAQQGVGLLFLKFGRDDERQSDQLGAEYSSRIGYDAQEMAGFFETLKRQRDLSGGEQIPTFMSSHPDPAERNESVKKYADEWQTKLNLTDPKVNRNEYLRLIDGLVFGEDPRQGFVENSNFYHPTLKFTFSIPNGWGSQNSPQQFQMAEPNGKANMALTLAEGTSAAAAATKFVEQYKLELIESKNLKVNGLNAVAIVADQSDEAGNKAIRATTYFIEYNSNVYSLMGISSFADHGLYAGNFMQTMESFKVLTDTDKLNRQPQRVKIVEVQANASLQSALSGFGASADQMAELSLLNGMQLTDQVSKGMLIKVLR